MFPLPYLMLCYLYLAEYTVSINPSSLCDIASGKQTAILLSEDSELYFKNGEKLTCDILYPQHSKEPAVYHMDLRQRYPIILINMTVNSTVPITGGIKVIVDDRLCAVPNLTNGANEIKCSSYITGRIFTVKAYVNVTVCKVQIYTCSAGKRGSNCELSCVNGTYGIGCRSCNCRSNDSCSKSDGFCPSGCVNANYDKNYDCFYTSITRNQDGHFASLTKASINGITFIPSINRNEIILQRTDIFDREEQNCTIFESGEKSRVAVAELSYQESIVVRHVEITYCHIAISLPYSIHITVNGSSCFGLTVYEQLSLSTHTFTCQRKTAVGNTLIITHTSHDANSNSTVLVGFSKIAVLACAKGFYGSTCKLPCHCLGSACDPVTGYCRSGLCGIFARGPNCASVNIAFLRPVSMRTVMGHPLHLGKQSASLKLLPAVYYRMQQKWLSWRMVQLDGVYHIQGITVHVNKEIIYKFRNLAVYTDTVSYSGRDVHGSYFWQGLGCTGNQIKQTGTVIDVQCSGPALVIIIVIHSYSPFFAADVKDIEVWTCEDGTFGSLCEGICNCRIDEVCHKDTGECPGGCAEGYWGLDCQSPCVSGSVEPSCWHVCNCTDTSGCGPGVILCDKCPYGWMGVKCDIPCPNGWYGRGCTEQCGPCKNDTQEDYCYPTNGHCKYGCTNELLSPTCKVITESPDILTEAAMANEPDNTITYITFGLGSAIVGAAVIYLCIRIYLVMRAASTKKQRRTECGSAVNEKIMREHRDYHENFVHKKVLEQATFPEKSYSSCWECLIRCGRRGGQRSSKSTPKLLFGIKRDYKGKLPGPDRCKPLEDNTQQNADQKVAMWILREDFSFLINRRQDRLKNYVGDILNIKESAYTVSEINLTRDELEKLYEEVGSLGIP